MGRWRDQTLGLRLTEEEKEIILRRMAEAGHKNVTDYIICCVCRDNLYNIDTRIKSRHCVNITAQSRILTNITASVRRRIKNCTVLNISCIWKATKRLMNGSAA